ncbi:MAG TPA: hypothetical protein VJH65_01410 [Candidatus Nanoarchaeia archaeon]|nr:hypothetical protein [Candidatus Nanoarchaeia archaeon]
MGQITSIIVLGLVLFISSLILYFSLSLIILLIAKIFKRKIKIKKNVYKLLKTGSLFALISMAISIFLISKILLNPPTIEVQNKSGGVIGSLGTAIGSGIAVGILALLGIIFSAIISTVILGIIFVVYVIINIFRNKYH